MRPCFGGRVPQILESGRRSRERFTGYSLKSGGRTSRSAGSITSPWRFTSKTPILTVRAGRFGQHWSSNVREDGGEIDRMDNAQVSVGRTTRREGRPCCGTVSVISGGQGFQKWFLRWYPSETCDQTFSASPDYFAVKIQKTVVF